MSWLKCSLFKKYFTMRYCRPSRHPSATICTSVFEAPDIMMSAIILFISHGLHLENGLKIENMKNSLNSFYSDGFPIHIDTISMGLPIVYLKRSQVEFLNFNVFLLFYISSGSSLFAKVPV